LLSGKLIASLILPLKILNTIFSLQEWVEYIFACFATFAVNLNAAKVLGITINFVEKSFMSVVLEKWKKGCRDELLICIITWEQGRVICCTGL
jgi:hypothetical protein